MTACASKDSASVSHSRLPSSQTTLRENDEGIDAFLNEEYEPNENASIQKVIDEAMIALKRDYSPPHIPRDAHAKSHGCLKASFTVDNSSLPEDLKVGIFGENKTYPTWVRFSNNTSDPMSHDNDLDLRGIAIKVMNVPGVKIIAAEENEETQDFLMFASPIFFIKDIKDYSEFIKALGNGKAIRDLVTRPKSLTQLATAQLKAKGKKNPVKLTYFSAVPFRLGSREDVNRKYVKYSVTACDSKAAEAAVSGNSDHPNFMREALKSTLEKSDVCFQFQIQIADLKKPKIFDVEDPSVLWPTKVSPYQTVATLKIPRQDFDTPKRDQFCERLSFTPWHSLPEHRPLGRTNRMRLKLYEAISKYRHEANGVGRSEPKSLDIDNAFN